MENITSGKEELFPIEGGEFLLYSLVFVIGVLSSMAGVGGGGILTPLFYLVGNYNLHYAIPLSIISIMGNSLIRLFLLVNKKHMLDNTIPLIDYGVLTQMIPFDSAGSYLGVFLNSIVEETTLKYLIIAFFSLITIKTFHKTYKVYKKEEKMKNEDNIVYIDGICVPLLRDNLNTEVIQTDRINIKMIILSIFLYLCGFAGLGVWKIYNKEWYVGFIQFLYCLCAGGVSIYINNVNKYSPNLKNNLKNSLIFATASFGVGTISTMMGIGGGMVFSVILLQLKLTPEIVMATNSVSTLTSSISSTLQYVSSNRLLIQIGGFSFLISCASAYIGLTSYQKFKKKFNRQSLIVLLLAILMVISVIMISLK